MSPGVMLMASTAEAGDVASSATITSLTDNISSGVQGVFKIAGHGFNFIVENPLCMLMVCLSFAGAGLGFVGRAFKTARK